MTYCKNYCEEKGISTSHLNDAQTTLYHIAENMRLGKSISEEGYKHFQKAIEALEQNGDCISRQEALEPYKTLNENDTISVWMIRKNIEQMPSITQQQKIGYWLKTGDMLTNNKGHIIHQVMCSECSGIAYFRRGCDKYIGATICPNCGARMVESEDER